MTISIVGRKCGMTRVFTPEGVSIPVTVIEALPNKVTQVKKKNEKDHYNAIQVTTGSRRRTRVTKPMAGHYAKANVEPGRGLWEFRTDQLADIELGSEITVGQFTVGELVDVTGTSKGKGFAGCIKRHHFSMQDATHGNSRSHRSPGSIGQRQSPGKVFKGKKMSGHMGDVRRTTLSQRIIKIDLERHLILISGAVPGATGGSVIVRSAVKAKNKQSGGQ